MYYLINAAIELGLDNIVAQAGEYSNIHGIMVDVDPRWLHLYKLHLMYQDDDLMKHARNYYYDDYYLTTPFLTVPPVFPTTIPMDIYWRPPEWESMAGNKSNLQVRLLLKPGSSSVNIRNEGALRVIQEHRAIPRLYAGAKSLTRPLQGGVSTGTGAAISGTLGGILQNPHTNPVKKYALTCGHVINAVALPADQPSQSDHGGPSFIGNSIFVETPFKVSTSLCTKYDNTNLFHDMDISLIELDPAIHADLAVLNTGKVNGFTPSSSLSRNLQVEYNGRTSGLRTLVLGGIGVTNNVEDPAGNKYCFEHLVELKDPSIANLAAVPPTQPGDSGAWVMTNGASGNEWCGMIVGGDSQTGYFIMSEKILDRLKANKYDLSCT